MRHLSLPKQNIISIVDQLDFVLHHGIRGTVLLFLVIVLEKITSSNIVKLHTMVMCFQILYPVLEVY